MEKAFDYLDAPVINCTGKDVPMPYAANLEKLALVTTAEVIAAVQVRHLSLRERVMPIQHPDARALSHDGGGHAREVAGQGGRHGHRPAPILAEIETDKATMEFEAVDEGTDRQDRRPRGHRGGEGQRR